MKKKLIKGIGILLAVVVLLLLAFVAVYFTRFQTIASIEKLTDYEDGYDIYRMDVQYDYSLDDLIARGITDDQSMIDTIVKEALPILPVHIEAPNFGCSAFKIVDTDQDVLMGRSYDFKKNTSAMLVYSNPKDGYSSVAFAALDNVSANDLEGSLTKKLAALTAPFICLDGVNEKGVSIAVLTLDSDPVRQDTGKPTIATTIAIRLVLDRAATTEEAVELLKSYDMFASSGRDYHFFINDASGDSRVVEWDCESPTRELVATPTDVTTNFFILYPDKVEPNQKNGIYGHGKERYIAICDVLEEQQGAYTTDTAWDALMAAAQEPNPESITSNTQWSIVFNNTDCTAEIVLRRNWNDHYLYDLNTNSIVKK